MALECLWDVKSLEDFLYYCCPECNERKQSREGFLTHALNQHPESNDFLVHYHHIKEELEESILVKKNDANEEASMIDEKYEPVVKIKEEDDYCEEILNVDDYPLDIKNSEDNNINGITRLLKHKKKAILLNETNLIAVDIAMKSDNIDQNGNNGHNNSGKIKSKSIKKHQQRCPICRKFYKKESSLRIHMKLNHQEDQYGSKSKGNNNAECDICQKSFKNQLALTKHVYGVHEQARYNCDNCSKTFSTAKNLQIHINCVHEEAAKEYICQHCSKAFVHKTQLYKHQHKVHNVTKLHQCDSCGKTFKYPSDLKKHSAVHGIKVQGERFKCLICSKSYTAKGTLSDHIKQIHEKQIEHQCEICGKNFATAMILRNHINCIHEGLRKFNCRICDKTFKYRTGLYFHSKTVHENIRYQCDQCEKSFTQLHTLKKHIEKDHKSN